MDAIRPSPDRRTASSSGDWTARKARKLAHRLEEYVEYARRLHAVLLEAPCSVPCWCGKTLVELPHPIAPTVHSELQLGARFVSTFNYLYDSDPQGQYNGHATQRNSTLTIPCPWAAFFWCGLWSPAMISADQGQALKVHPRGRCLDVPSTNCYLIFSVHASF
jgi:hypothetical protein